MTDRLANITNAVRSLDPRTKLLATAMLAAQIVGFDGFAATGASFGAVMLYAVLFKLPIGELLARVRKVTWFIIVITAVSSCTVNGQVITEVGGLFVTQEGLAKGLLLSTKVVLLLWCSLILAWTTPADKIVDALERWLSPVRKRAGAAITMVAITFNFVPLFVQAAQRIMLTQKARGLDIESTMREKIRFALSASLPLFATGFRASEQLAVSMEARCYDPHGERSSYNNLRMHVADVMWMASNIGLFVIAALLAS